MASFLGAPYPVTDSVYGYLHTQSDLDQIKSDLLILLLTYPSERVMLPSFGTPLDDLLFEPNDAIVAQQAKQMIANSIAQFEPRIAVSQINVSTSIATSELNPADNRSQLGRILSIQIQFNAHGDLKAVDDLFLELPLG